MNDWNPQHAAQLAAHGLYRPEDEHDACGVGVIAALNGKPSREVVEGGIAALKSVWHRGARASDGKTGDGAGVHLDLPVAFFYDYLRQFGTHPAKDVPLGVGMIFLPRTDFAAQEEARLVIETETIAFGYSIHCWRQVPINAEIIGDQARASCPEIAQLLIRGKTGESLAQFELQLYVLRRRIERRIAERAIANVYLCSLSCRYIIYKGLFLAEQLSSFYPDLTDPRVTSRYIIFHQRFSTNTNPTWHLAQPFRMVAHNGEINTLRGNLNWMSSFEASFGTWALSDYHEDIIPVVPPGLSDTGALDCVMELLVHAGKPAPMAKLMMVPPAWRRDPDMPPEQKAMFEYFTCLVSPWDGPAALVGTDGRYVFAGLDRNGLRPLRYTITSTGLLICGSEVGMVPVRDAEIVRYGTLGPGEILAVDMTAGTLLDDHTIKSQLAAAKPYAEWVAPLTRIHLNSSPLEGEPNRSSDLVGGNLTAGMNSQTSPQGERESLLRRAFAAGVTSEEIDLILLPMARDGKEAVGSMGDDTPLAILSSRYRGLHHFFRQHFSQVTNPPIDPLRERRVMSLLTRLGGVEHILGEPCDVSGVVQIDSPFLLSHEYEALQQRLADDIAVIDTLFVADGTPDALRHGIDAMLAACDAALAAGKHLIVLTDERSDTTRAAIPMILAAGALHTHMVRRNYRKKMSLIARTAAVLDVHSAAVLLGVGATAVNPYLAESLMVERHSQGHLGTMSLADALARYKTALSEGMLKILSKMGISVLVSYRGGRNFDAIGLSRALVSEFFPGLISRISGIGLKGLEQRVLAQHHAAWNASPVLPLPVGGFYAYRNTGEIHALGGDAIHTLQTACATGAYRVYKRYSEAMAALPPIHLRDLLTFRPQPAVPLEEVESVTAIRKRFVAPAMSLGSLSPEAHETLAIAMNKIGAASNSGEGGEGPERFHARANGDNLNSSVKQVASGRFGVTIEYLNACRELQIKVAQGAKPGEGGQLPGFKVTVEIARLRHATPGVTLISPPPHHDIYSIEDLAQLIYDLKQANPEAIVSVKLVAASGIGTIASGVAKAMADKIVIAGHTGGTGASPYSSIKHAGVPWEMGLAEAHQVLTLNGLRNRVVLQTDGGLKTGRDIVIAAMLGAEEYAIGTLSLVAMGCLLVRQCHSNTCPVGICTQDESLRNHFEGTVDKVVNLMTFIAEEVREILASLGFRSLDDIIGRADLLAQIHRGEERLDALDLGPLLAQANPLRGDGGLVPREHKTRNAVAESLDETILHDIGSMLDAGENIQLSYSVQNTHRTIGTRLSSYLVRHYPNQRWGDAHITLRLRGIAGQSLGAFLARAIRIELIGCANDYVGKGLSGGTIIVAPSPSSTRPSEQNAIIGNTVLYGATAGTLFASGLAGERFAVRNSGAIAVIEGCGANACEYMTGGTVVILGKIGPNFAAGMTGGMAFVYDPLGKLPAYINGETVVYQRLASHHWEQTLRDLVTQFERETGSFHAQTLLAEWPQHVPLFWQICPREMLSRLVHPLTDTDAPSQRNAG